MSVGTLARRLLEPDPQHRLLPLTRLLVFMSGFVPLVFGGAMAVAPGFVNDFLWPRPLDPVPRPTLLFLAASSFALTAGAAYALRRDDWRVASGFLGFSGPYVALSIVAALITAAIRGAPAILWLYVALACCYVPLAIVVWVRESRREPALGGR